MKKLAFLLILLAVTLCGCGDKEVTHTDNTSYPIYETTYTCDLPVQEITCLTVFETQLFMVDQHTQEIVTYDNATKELATIPLLATSHNIVAVGTTDGKSIYGLTKGGDGFSICELVTNQFLFEVASDEDAIDMLVLEDGTFYIATQTKVAKYNMQGECISISSVVSPYEIEMFLHDTSKGVYVIAEAEPDCISMLSVDVSTNSIHPIDVTLAVNDISLLWGNNHAIIYYVPNTANAKPNLKYGGILYSFDVSTGNTNVICDTVSIGSSGLLEYSYCYEKELVSILYDEETSSYKLVSTSQTTSTKTQLTIARTENNQYIAAAIQNFNQLNTEYFVSSKYYFGDNPGLDLSLDIISGDGPDLVSLYDFPIETYVKQGVLQDMYRFIDDDPEISREDFSANVLQVLETDGALYQIAPTYYVEFLCAAPSLTEGITSWSMDDIKRIMTANPSVILCGFDPNSGYSYSGQILSTLLRYSYNDYINDQKDQYIFDTEKVMDLLAFCKEMGGRIDSYASNGGDPVISGEMLFYNGIYRDLKDFGIQYGTNAIGYPTSSGSGVAINSVIRFGICSKSKNQLGAWEFIKATLSESYQEELPWLPIRCSSLNKLKELAKLGKTGKPSADENTIEYHVEQDLLKNPPSQSEINDFFAIISSADRLVNDYESRMILDIFLDEAEPYFYGDKQLQDVVAVIKSRISIMIAEQS